MKQFRSLLVLAVVLGFSVASGFGQSEVEKVRPGLAGAQFDDKEFTEVDDDPNILYSLNQHWAALRGNDWRAAWFGFVEGPFTGEVRFSAEFEDGLELVIGGEVVIDGVKLQGRNQMSGSVRMVEGKKIPISVKFETYHSKAFMRVLWEWEGQPKTLVPPEALGFRLDSLPPDLRFEFEYAGLENVQTWVNYAPVIPPVPDGQIDVSEARVVVLSKSTILNKAADLLVDEVAKRSRRDLQVAENIDEDRVNILIGAKADFEERRVSVPSGLNVPEEADGYAIWVEQGSHKPATVYLIGHDARGTLFAAGRLLRLLDMGRDWAYLNRDIRISTAPVTKLRGHQIGYRPKTNSYDGWTIEMWEQYYRDMIVFGTNAVELLPPRTDDALDSPHFPEPPLQMMVKMSQLAADYGLDVWIWFPSMEDDYSDEKILNLVLEEWEVIFSALPKIDVVFVPGGDPGNSHPSVLMSFLSKQKKRLNRHHPNAQVWMSPQGFGWKKGGEGWLQDFYDILNNEEPAWLDGVVFGPAVAASLPKLREAVPARFPIRRYPDITHSGGGQYEVEDWDDAYRGTLGREPINPRPYAYADIYRKLDEYAIGFITYSEGCNDDVNKIIWSSLGWDPEAKVEDILTEYSKHFIAYEFRDRFAEGLAGLERNWEGPVKDNESVFETLSLFQEMEKDARPADLLNWRFQQGLYRAYYDAYVKAKLPWAQALEREVGSVLNNAAALGSLETMEQANILLDTQFKDPIALQWRNRVHELAEALFQSARMQLSVPKYKAIRRGRGATLDTLDEPLFDVKGMKKEFMHIRMMDSELERLQALGRIIGQ
jgi:hypothetical protein